MTSNCSDNTTSLPPNPVIDKTINPQLVFSFIGVMFVIVGGSICIALTPESFKQRVISDFGRLKRLVICSTITQHVDVPNVVQSHSTELSSQNYEVISLYNEYPTWNVDYTSSEQDQDRESVQASQIQSNNGVCNLVDEPPSYSSIVSKIPEDVPPTYEEVTANPTGFEL